MLFNIEKKKKYTRKEVESNFPRGVYYLRTCHQVKVEALNWEWAQQQAVSPLLGGEKKNPDDFCMQDILRKAWVGEV